MFDLKNLIKYFIMFLVTSTATMIIPTCGVLKEHAIYVGLISASTFAFWPIWTNKQLLNVIAPKYWFDWSRSDGWWRPKDGIVNDDRWLWLSKYGLLYESKTCKTLADEYYG